MSKDFSDWYTCTSSGKVKCKACSLEFANRKCRMLSHLGYEGKNGSRDTGISLCTRLTSAVRTLFVRCEGSFPRRSNLDIVDGQNLPIVESNTPNGRDSERSTQEDSCTAPLQTICSTSGIQRSMETSSQQGTPPSSITRRRRQRQLTDGFEEADRRNLNTLWAHFFYSANIPFAVARSEAFKEAVKRTAEFKRPYSPPSYVALRTKLLDEAKGDVEVKLQKRTQDSIRKFGATLSIDGWSSVKNQPLINVMLVSSAGEQFLGSVDTSGFEKTGEYLAGILDNFIQKVGPENVVQITTDNAAVNPKAVGIITKKYPHITFQGCVVHALNLLLKDWGKEVWVMKVLTEARLLLKFFRKRHMPLAIFRSYEKDLSLLMPGETRFASNFIALERLLKVKTTLKQSITDPRWNTYVRTLSDKENQSRSKSRVVKSIIECREFWKNCKNFVQMVGPVVFGLRDLDAKTPLMGKVLHVMRKIRKHVVEFSHPPFHLTTNEVEALQGAFQIRWELVQNDLMYAGALLNPYLLYDEELADDGHAIEECKKVFRRICKREDYADVVKEFMAFRHREPPFHNMLDPSESKLSAHAWWDFEGVCGKLIAPIARRILGQTVSSSACERNWSSYSFVHSKSRNKLKTKRAMDLVYVYTNSKVLSTSKERDEKEWYRENAESEDSEGPVEDEDSSDDDDDFLDGNLVNHLNDKESEDTEQSEDEQGKSDDELANDVGQEVNEANQAMHNSSAATWNVHHDIVANKNTNPYDFPLEDGHCESDEEVPSIARFLDGSRLLCSETILANKEVANIPMAPEIGTTIIAAISQGGEVHDNENSPLATITRLESNEERNAEDQVNVDYTMLESRGALASNESREQSTMDPTTQVPVINVGSEFIQCGSPNMLQDNEAMTKSIRGSKHLQKNDQQTAPRVLFDMKSTTLLSLRSSASQMRVSNISLSPSDDDNRPLDSFVKIRREGCLLQSPSLPLNGKLKSLNEIHGSNSERQQTLKASLQDCMQAKRKRVMEPFFIPQKKKAKKGRPPLDIRQRKEVPPPKKGQTSNSLRQHLGKTLIQVKKEKTDMSKRVPSSKKGHEKRGGSQLSSSDDEDSMFDSQDDELPSNDCSSGAEVKGDENYYP